MILRSIVWFGFKDGWEARNSELFFVKACCTAPGLNPNNPYIKEPRKSKRRALFSHGLLESASRAHLEQEEASTQRGKRAHAGAAREYRRGKARAGVPKPGLESF